VEHYQHLGQHHQFYHPVTDFMLTAQVVVVFYFLQGRPSAM